MARLGFFWRIVLWGVVGSAVAVVPVSAQQPPKQSGEAFLAELDANPSGALEGRRLSRFLFGEAAALDAGRSSLRILAERAFEDDADRARIRSVLRSLYNGYSSDLVTFRRQASQYLDDPDSDLLLQRSHFDGLRACWKLDRFVGTLESYGAGTAEMLPTLTSRQVCRRVQQALFHPRVERALRRSMIQQVYDRQELGELRRELEESEALLRELAGEGN